MTRASRWLLPVMLMLPFWATVTAFGPLLAYEVDLNRVAGLAVLGLLALWLRQRPEKSAKAASVGLLLLVALVATTIALGDGSDPLGLSQAVLYASAVVLGMWCAALPHGWERQLRCYMALKLLALAVAFVLCQWASDALGSMLIPHPPVYLHTRLLGMEVFYAIVLLLAVVASSGKPALRWHAASLGGAAMLAGYFTAWFAARGSLVALLLFLLTAWIFVPPWRRTVALVAAALVAGAVLCVLAGDTDYLARRLARSHADLNAVTSGRWRIWTECYQWWVSSPGNLLFGAGPDAFRLEAWTGRNNRAIQPHNAVVQVTLEWGLLGLMASAAMVAALLRRVVTLLRSAHSPDWQKLVACAMPALLAYALVDGIFYHAVSVLPAAVLIGLLFSPGAEPR